MINHNISLSMQIIGFWRARLNVVTVLSSTNTHRGDAEMCTLFIFKIVSFKLCICAILRIFLLIFLFYFIFWMQSNQKSSLIIVFTVIQWFCVDIIVGSQFHIKLVFSFKLLKVSLTSIDFVKYKKLHTHTPTQTSLGLHVCVHNIHRCVTT